MFYLFIFKILRQLEIATLLPKYCSEAQLAPVIRPSKEISRWSWWGPSVGSFQIIDQSNLFHLNPKALMEEDFKVVFILYVFQHI